MTEEQIRTALIRAYNLGQKYWQQADSEYQSEWEKARATDAKFRDFVKETVAAFTSQHQE